ncbi:MAG: hypothetical protein IKC93_06520 [Candidatus Methanomethylophilaceae archaeon]|nr:hypothetical protein [Candidatus Methanomethylophilaceae archaeon]MBR7124497.1 hypothetical protein [Candidatus Methanomethylophilaceae archaeon]
MFCVHCGTFNEESNNFCASCGASMMKSMQSSPADRAQVSRKSPVLALVLAFFIPGAGQIYMEKVARGLIVLVITTLTIMLLFGLISWFYGMIDALILSNRWNRELERNPYSRPWNQ